jgi:hypothetical protein
MRLCYDNDIIYYDRIKQKFRLIGYHAALFYYDSCEECGNEFVSKSKSVRFCSKKCSTRGERNPMYGQHWDEEKKKAMAIKISVQYTGMGNPMYGKSGELSPTYGRKHTVEERKKISNHSKLWWAIPVNKEKMSVLFTGKKITDNHKEKLRTASIGSNNHQWKGGYSSNNIPMYDTYAPQLEPYEQYRRNEDNPNILEVKCTYCGKWYIPKLRDICHRIAEINIGNAGHRLYCSSHCKQECPIYGRSKHYKGQNGHFSREVQPQLRQLVFERDNYICQKCEQIGKLHCHHIKAVITDPIESADIDNCITLCNQCHKEVHKLSGCGYSDLKCKEKL